MVTNTGSYDIFDAMYPDYKCKKPVRLIEFFGGIGSQAKALERLGVDHEAYKLVEIDKFAVDSYNAIHGTTFSTSDITELHGEDLSVVSPEIYDYILTWSFPCGRAGTLINTRRGLVKIEDVKVGDYVLTHDGSWQMVTWSGKTGEKELYSIKAMCVPSDTQYTYNHPFYVRKKLLSVDSGKVKVSFSEPKFKSCGEIAADDSDWYCGFKINTESRIPIWEGIDLKMGPTRYEHRDTINSFIANPDFWWIVGRYVADGWHRQQGGIIIACGWPNGREDLRGVKTEALLERFDRLGVHAIVANEKTCDKVHVTYREWEAFLDPIGRGAMNKEIPQFILDLPEFLLKAFVDGYLAGDGYFDEKTGSWRAASVSRALAMGLSQAIMKAYHVGVSVQCKLYEEGHTCFIEGREVNQHSVWMLSFKPDSITGKSFYENDYIWFPFYGIEPTGNIESVYDLTVENSHSFIGDNIVVHNCQALSVAGLRKGMHEGSGTSSSLIWEVRRLLQEMQDLSKKDGSYGLPKILLMENVPQVIDAKNVQDLNKMRDFLESIGYSNHLAILKGNDYGVPQARHRAFMVSILGDETNPVYSYQFPYPCGCKWSMQDCLSDDFEAKQVIKNSVAHDVCNENAAFNRNPETKLNEIKLCGRLNAHQAGGVFDPCGVSPTLTAGGASSVNVLWRQKTENADSEDWNNMYWFGSTPGVNETVIEDQDSVIDYFFNVNEENEPAYEKQPDYEWVPVVRDQMEYKIRTLTPKESLQIMDFDETDYKKASLVTSNHQMHKQAGNSIVVNCIVALLGQFFEGKENVYREIAEIPPKSRAGFTAVNLASNIT